jgi:MoxR-like ATPase
MIAMPTTPNFVSSKPSLDNLQAIERELTILLVERDEVICAAIIALLTRQHLVILGPPGTAKSALINEIAQRISPHTGEGLRSFNYLSMKSTRSILTLSASRKEGIE